MTDDEREQQRRSFAFGNANIDNPNVTREAVDAAAEQLSLADLSAAHALLRARGVPIAPGCVAGELERLYRESEWISVDERLPEDGVRVLVCNPATADVAEWIDTARWSCTASVWVNLNWHRDLERNEVTHWMPLPAAAAAAKADVT